MTSSLSLHPQVMTLTAEAAPLVISTLAEAFRDYPVMRYVLADEEPDYLSRLHMLVRLFVMARALRADPMIGIFAGPELCAAATMSDPQDTNLPPAFSALRDETWDELGSAARARYDRCVAAWQPLAPDVPQLHVNMIGVRRAFQGKGFSRRLLDHIHGLSLRSAAATGVSLTTETRANVALYQHFGYRIVGHTHITETLEAWGFFRPNEHRA